MHSRVSNNCSAEMRDFFQGPVDKVLELLEGQLTQVEMEANRRVKVRYFNPCVYEADFG
jgi:hypothetical protein